MAQDGYRHQPFPAWVHHPTGAHTSKIVLDEDEESALLAEWGIDKDEADLGVDPLRDQLLARAARVGVDANPRWSDKRLIQEVEKAEAHAAHERR